MEAAECMYSVVTSLTRAPHQLAVCLGMNIFTRIRLTLAGGFFLLQFFFFALNDVLLPDYRIPARWTDFPTVPRAC